jgi:D-arabinose 5-phosphate isomerase GutQ
VSIKNVQARLGRIVDSFDAQIEYIEKRGAADYYGSIFDTVPQSDYLVLTGRGRLRHIADKMSASLASTGTPSYYMDTSDDPSHLNRLGPSDQVLLVHSSDEPRGYLTQLLDGLGSDVPLNVITDRRDGWPSRPGQVLVVKAPDTVPPGVEPDILSMALGDTLLAGLESARGFTEVDFLKDHPKGSLGKNIAADQKQGEAKSLDYLPPAEQALQALREERDGIAALWDQLDRDALAMWLETFTRGGKRIITTGMGKPGYCMRYLTVLMNELGSASFYVHPAECVHGDLGRIGDDSVVVAYSHSGETDEMLNILPRMKERGATLLSLTNNIESTLGKQSDVVLKAGAPEVDPIRKAPTGSTVAALSLATALVASSIEV